MSSVESNENSPESTTPNPAGILCGNGHRHSSVDQVKYCHLGTSITKPATWADTPAAKASPHTLPVAVPVPPMRPSVAPLPATQAQRDAILRHGITLKPGATRTEASEILTRLIDGKDRREGALKADTASTADLPAVMTRTMLGIPAAMLFDIREGRFAVSPAGTKKVEFVRLSHIKPNSSGSFKRYAGSLKVQTKHGDQLQTRAIITRDGDVILTSTTMGLDRLTQIFMLIITDQRGAAKLYGREKGECCRCGKDLTDERSRYYGIGPECEKHWEEYVPDIDETEGVFVPGVLLDDMNADSREEDGE